MEGKYIILFVLGIIVVFLNLYHAFLNRKNKTSFLNLIASIVLSLSMIKLFISL